MGAPKTHGKIRGLDVIRGSQLFAGPFGRMFRALPPADYGRNDMKTMEALGQLGDAMSAKPEPPKDGPDDEESGIPAAFTYFGQFIDHDLTFDPSSSLQKQNDPEALVDYRTPRFDLDNLYGRGPDDQPYLYSDGRKFNLGRTLTGAPKNPKARDLPRSNPDGQPHRAIIGDPRNDENIIVSQLQGLFLRFHNKVADLNPSWSFLDIQREVRFHYQWVVLNDFLPTIISPEVLDEVLPHLAKKTNVVKDCPRLEFYHPKEDLFMPLEFSVAAYRFGHSMIRPGYRLNDNDDTLLPIFPFGKFKHGLTGFDEFPGDWAIDWGRFIDLEPRPAGDDKNEDDPGNKTRTQLAYKIDTSLVGELKKLPGSVAPTPPHGLAHRNLLRGWRMRLPCGQDVARAMGLEPLKDEDIKIGKFTGNPDDIVNTPVGLNADAFQDNCPLWTYVLAETVPVNVTFKTADGDRKLVARKLGPVGGRIVTETFVGILLGDSSSYLSQDPLWKPTLAKDGVFGLRELISTALSD